MFDKVVYKYSLEQLLEHIKVVESRFVKIDTPGDFVSSDNGILILDAIVARLQAIGENVKRILKQYPNLAEKYPNIDWKNIIRFRDFISHHYELLDYEIVFQICDDYLIEIKKVVLSEIEEK